MLYFKKSINNQKFNQHPKLISQEEILFQKMSSFNGRNYEKNQYSFHFISSRKKYLFKRLLMIATLLTIISILTLSLFCPESLCSSRRSYLSKQWISTNYLVSYPMHHSTSPQPISERINVDRILLNKFGYDYDDYIRFKFSKLRSTNFDQIFNVNTSNRFQMNKNDVLVFLHMQKTGMDRIVLLNFITISFYFRWIGI